MDNLQCAIALAKLDSFDQAIAERQVVARRCHDSVATGERAITLTENPKHRGQKKGRTSIFVQSTLLAEDRDAL